MQILKERSIIIAQRFKYKIFVQINFFKDGFMTVFDFTVKISDGKPVELSSYKNSVMLIVNTASA